MNYHKKSGAQKRKERLAKVRNTNERQTLLQSLGFSILSTADDAANQVDNIIASSSSEVDDHGTERVVDVVYVYIASDISSPPEIGHHNETTVTSQVNVEPENGYGSSIMPA